MELNVLIELKALLRRSRNSGRSRGFEVDIDIGFLEELWEAQKGRCAVSGLQFTREAYKNAFVKTPFAPSIDRIDSAHGYLKGNVRLDCVVSNFALNQWGDNVLRRISHGVVETEKKVHRAWFRDQRRKLRQAEANAETMIGPELARQRRVIAGLKRILTMGPARLSGAAFAANRTVVARK